LEKAEHSLVRLAAPFSVPRRATRMTLRKLSNDLNFSVSSSREEFYYVCYVYKLARHVNT